VLAPRVASLEDDHHLVAGLHHPVLQLDQFALQAEQFPEVGATRGASGVGALQVGVG
jgi:hypothetical protein